MNEVVGHKRTFAKLQEGQGGAPIAQLNQGLSKNVGTVSENEVSKHDYHL